MVDPRPSSTSPALVLSLAAYLLAAVIGLGVILSFADAAQQGPLAFAWLGFTGLTGGLHATLHNVVALRRTVGDTNGESLATVIGKIAALDAYTHDQAHANANGIAALTNEIHELNRRLGPRRPPTVAR